MLVNKILKSKACSSVNINIYLSLMITLLLVLGGSLPSAQASDFNWSGLYRVEGVNVQNVDFQGQNQNKSYALHHLVLQPKIIAADGFTIYSRFDIFNAMRSTDINSQVGQVFGFGPGRVADSVEDQGRTQRETNVLSNFQASDFLLVNQLYLRWSHEFGSLVVGRAPIDFGLGITHNSGQGLFDHWYENHDMIGYKVSFGNLFIFPIFSKVNEGQLDRNDDIDDYFVHAEYNNPDTELVLGAIINWRAARYGAADAPLKGGNIGGENLSYKGDYDHRIISIYNFQKLDSFRVGVEAGLLSGHVGAITSTGSEIKLKAYAAATDIRYQAPASPWEFGLLAGIASGDNPGTDDIFEGYLFSRNYNVAFLMFNHPLGTTNILRTGLNRNSVAASGELARNSNQFDSETLSNVIYFSPRFKVRVADNVTLGASVTSGLLQTQPIVGQSSSAQLGYETDFSVNYRPSERVTWITEAGLLFPGEAWKGNDLSQKNNIAFGLATKAAISF